MKTLTLLWTFLLALQSNRSAEFSILHSPALIPKFPQSPSSSYLFSHFDFSSCGNEGVLLLYMSQSPSSSYLFSHIETPEGRAKRAEIKVAIALKLLPVFTLKFDMLRIATIAEFSSRNRPQALTCFHTISSCSGSASENSYRRIVAIALKLLPVFTQFLFLMQETCAFLNSKILTSLSNPF